MVRADHREAEAAAGLYSLPFPLGEEALFPNGPERSRARR
jgi:hypothetical protein